MKKFAIGGILIATFVASLAAQTDPGPLLDKIRALLDEYASSVAVARTWAPTSSTALQAALVAARGGDTIVLTAGATYAGSFQLPKHDGDAYITIRTSATLPERRLTDADLPKLAKLVSKVNGQPTITTATGAHHWRLVGLDVSQTGGNTYGIIRCGSAEGYTALDHVPHHVDLDRLYVHVADAMEERRGIQTNCADITVRRSIVRNIKETGADSQAVGGWDGMARVSYLDNDLQAASEPILIGGAPSSKVTPVPEDIDIIGNTIHKPLAWNGRPWNLKNLLELKNARRVHIADNVLFDNAPGAQTGWSVLFTARGGVSYPWATLEDITFERNVLRNVSSGINILGLDNETTVPIIGRRITIRNNLTITNSKQLGGEGRCYMLLGGANDVEIDHNTCIQDGGSVLNVDHGNPTIFGFRFTNNVQLHRLYGIIGDGTAPGTPTIEQIFTNPVVQGNVFGDCQGTPYPPGNQCPSLATFLSQFVNATGGDYRLKPSSAWKKAGTDGVDLGANMEALPQ